MSHDRGCPWCKERYEYVDCRDPKCRHWFNSAPMIRLCGWLDELRTEVSR